MYPHLHAVLLPALYRSSRRRRLDDEALCLDMGQYCLPAGLRLPADAPKASGRGIARSSGSPCGSQRSACAGKRQQQQGAAGPCMPGPDSKGCGAAVCDCSSVRVVQLLAPVLVGRAKVFGNQLMLRAGMPCLDMPYFDAPSTQTAPLGAELQSAQEEEEVCMPACWVDCCHASWLPRC